MSFKHAVLTVLLALSTTALQGQDKGPERNQVLVTLREEGNFGVFRYDLKNNKLEKLLGSAEQQFFANATSPSGKRFVGISRTRGIGFETRIYETTSVKEIKQQPFAGLGHVWACFLDEKTVLGLGRMGKARDAGHSILRCDLESGKTETLYESKDSYWDDVQLSLTPDKKHAIYFKRGEPGGLTMVDVKTGAARFLHPGSIITWSPDSKRFLAFHKKQRRLELCTLAKDGKAILLKDFGEGSVLGAWLGSNEQMLIGRVPEGSRSLEVQLHDEKNKKQTLFSSKVPSGELTLPRFFDFHKSSKRIIWIEGERESMSLRLAKIEDGAVKGSKTIIESKEMIGLPFFVP